MFIETALRDTQNSTGGQVTRNVGQCIEARGGAVGWGTVLQAGRSRILFSMGLLEFFID